jgi:electron transport complex protein RnfB
MLSAVVAITLLATIFGLLLGYAAIRFKVKSNPVVEQVDALLPQTQCGQCGFGGCRPYAEAIAAGEADINRCPPGGEATIQSLADLLDREPKALDEETGEHKGKRVARINENLCIGCTLCIQACPVDAILGAAKQMHTVIESECTGCDLCLPPCPVDCIEMVSVKEDIHSWKWPFPEQTARSLSDLGDRREGKTV